MISKANEEYEQYKKDQIRKGLEQRIMDNPNVTKEELDNLRNQVKQRALNWAQIEEHFQPPNPIEVYYNNIQAAFRKLLGASKARKLILDNLYKSELEVGQAVAELTAALESVPTEMGIMSKDEARKLILGDGTHRKKGENDESKLSE